MEVFCIILLMLLLVGNFLLYRETRKISASLKTFESKQADHTIYLKHIFDIVNSIPQANGAPQTPIKPNNWDSIREAFKGPTRVEINERT